MENQGVISSMGHQKRGFRLVLFPLPLQGHINPMLQLANILHTRGFSISIIHTHFNSPKASNYPHFAFHVIPDGLLENQASADDVIDLLSLLNAKCVAPFRKCLAGLLLSAGDGGVPEEPIACLITDAQWNFSQSVADGLKIPRIVLRTSSIAGTLAFAALTLAREKGHLPKQDSELDIPVKELPPLKIRDLPTLETREPENLYKIIGSMIKEIKASKGLIWNTFEELEPSELATAIHDFGVPNFPIGPFQKYSPATSSSSLLVQDQSSISWIGTQPPKSVLYVSFGSIASTDEAEFVEMAWGLANSMQPFLWVVRPGVVRGSEWLGPLPGGFMETIGRRGKIVKWAPQQEVLAHPSTGGFWTHNGWNSTLESICEGVPMICSPRFGDQFVNARYVADVWRIGLVFQNLLERVEVEKTIRRVMTTGKEGEEMRDRIQFLKERVDLCLKKGGSSTRYLDSLISYILSLT